MPPVVWIPASYRKCALTWPWGARSAGNWRNFRRSPQLPLALDSGAPGSPTRAGAGPDWRRSHSRQFGQRQNGVVALGLAAGFLLAFVSASVFYAEMREAQRDETNEASLIQGMVESGRKQSTDLLIKIAQLQDEVSSLDGRYQQLANNAKLTEDMLKFPQWENRRHHLAE